jgi:hypothetical protein
MTTTAHTPVSERSSFGETLAEVVPLVEVVPVDGPPFAFLLAPWLFLVLMLAGPFACLVVIVVAMVVAAAVVAAVIAAVAGIIAAPYLLVGRVRRRRRERHRSAGAPAAPVVAIRPRGVAA